MLREAIDARGLTTLVAPDGATAAAQMADQLERGEATPTNYDPLMTAHWAIVTNAFEAIKEADGPVLYLMAADNVPEDPVEGYGPEYDGRTWPRCPLCYLNLAHEVSCAHDGCVLDRVRGYDHWIERAADEQVEAWKEIKERG